MRAKDVKEMFLYVSDRMIESEERLTEIDSKIGDGDHGIGMRIGFLAIKNKLVKKEYTYINDIFHDIGYEMLSEMGGASGVLFGTIFISGIINYDNKENFELEDFSEIFNKSLLALKERGKASVGDKTMIDALEPACHALNIAYKNDLSLKEGFDLASKSAIEGMESTKNIMAKFGRAKYYREASVGYYDAGAVSVAIIFSSMKDYINNNI